MKFNAFKAPFFFLWLALFSLRAGASNQVLTYQGVLTNSMDEPYTTSQTVTFELRSPVPKNCLLYKEDQNITPDAAGRFTAKIGTGTRTDGLSHSFDQVFLNGSTLTGLTCDTADTSYAAAPTDDRSLVIIVNGTPLSPAVAINAVPFAIQAQESQKARSIDGWGLQNLVKISSSGDSTTFSTLEMGRAKDMAGLSCASGQIMKWNGANWTCGTDDTGTPPGDAGYGVKGLVGFDTNATVSGIRIGSGVASVNMGTSAGQIVQLDSAAKLPAVDASNLTNLSAPQINGVLGVHQGGTGAGSFAANRLIASSASGSSFQAVTPCAQNQVLSFDATGVYTCSTVASLFPAAFVNGGNSFGGSAAAALGTNDAFNLDLKTNGTARLSITADGKVSVGTTSPVGLFEIQGGTAASENNGQYIVLKAQNAGDTATTPGKNGGNIYLTPGLKSAASGSTTTGQDGGVLIGNGFTPAETGSTYGLYVRSNTQNKAIAAEFGPLDELNLPTGFNLIRWAKSADLPVDMEIGKIGFLGRYGGSTGSASTAADIIASVDGGPGTASSPGTMPGRIEFRTRSTTDSSPATRMVIKNDGKIGIGTRTPAATLDIEGFMRLKKYASGAPPPACSSQIDGAIALKDDYQICVCNGTVSPPKWMIPGNNLSNCW